MKKCGVFNSNTLNPTCSRKQYLQPKSFEQFQPNYSECVGCLLEQILILAAHHKQLKPSSAINEDNDMQQHFIAEFLPNISIKDYIIRLHTYTQLSDCCCISTLIYIDRVMQKYPQMNLSFSNIHRLVLSCFVLAAKYLQDELQTQLYLSRVAGVSVDELQDLQIIIMDMLEWNAYISPQQYSNYKRKLDILAYQSFIKRQELEKNKQAASFAQINSKYVIKESEVVCQFSSRSSSTNSGQENDQLQRIKGLEKSIQNQMREDTVDKKTLASSSSSSSSVIIPRSKSFPNSSSSNRIAMAYEDEKEQQIAFSYSVEAT